MGRGECMKLVRLSIRTDKLPLVQIFVMGIVVGILAIHFGRSFLLENTGFLDENTLYNMKYMSVDSKAYFYYVLRARLGKALFLAVLATTYLGVVLCAGTALWYGISVGAFLSAAMLRYGLKGFFLVVISAFPQYIIYAPVLLSLLVWCEKLCRGIYFQRTIPMGKGIDLLKSANLMRLIIILLLLLIGCFLESFLNPHLLTAFLKIF